KIGAWAGTVITFIDEAGERGRITAAIAVARQWHARGRSVLLADASADRHIRDFAEAAPRARRSRTGYRTPRAPGTSRNSPSSFGPGTSTPKFSSDTLARLATPATA